MDIKDFTKSVAVIEYTAYGQLLSSAGNRGPYAAPQGVYPCAERQEYVALAGGHR
jgi:hypothetical protein